MRKSGSLLMTVFLLGCLSFARPLVARGQQAASPQVTAIKFGTLITEDADHRVLKNAVVIVDGDRIRSVGAGAETAIPAGAKVIDLSAYTGIPGLIDAHTHITYYWSGRPGTTPFTDSRGRLPQEIVFYSQQNARQCLEIGVTTVRDLEGHNYNDLALRNLINAGAIEGPRMFVAGPAVHAGGAAPQLGLLFPGEHALGSANGVAEVMETVREEIAAGIDVVKVFASTGSFQDVTEHETFTYDEIQAAVQVAHQMGKRIAVHTYGPDGARDAARAGADTIEHPVDMDDATIAEMAAKHLIYTPTVYHNAWYAENAKEFDWNAAQVAALNDFVRRNEETVRRALKAGVRIEMGSDAVYNLFGKNTHELEYLVKSGMTPAQALEAATTNAAMGLGMEKSLGAVGPGYFADIVAVQGDPLANIDVAVDGVRWVMKGGKVVVNHIQ